MARWSYSQLALYKKCPRLFQFERVEKRPLPPYDLKPKFIGQVLEQVVQQFYGQEMWRTPKTLVASMQALVRATALRVSNEERVPWQRGEMEKWIGVAHDAVPSILRVIRDERLLDVSPVIEHELRSNIGEGHTVFGRADFIFTYPDGRVRILDGKGGGTIGRNVSGDQLRLYALATGQAASFKNTLPDKVGFWWYRHGKIVWKKIDPVLMTKFKNGVLGTIHRVMAKDYAPTPGPHCKYCHFKPDCPEGRAHLAERAARKTVFATDRNYGTVSLGAELEVPSAK